VAGAAGGLARAESGLSQVRLLSDVLDRLPEYELTVLREWMAEERLLPTDEALWRHRADAQLEYPWPTAAGGGYPDEQERKRRDAWQQLFMPRGTFLASRVDTNHWLTVGSDRFLPVLVGAHPVLMSGMGVETPVRYGWLRAAAPGTEPGGESVAGEENEAPAGSAEKKKETARIGWCVLPGGTEMQLRMSGLLWPEATHRLANAAAVTREPMGRGQVILFATPPAFRGSSHGTTRLLLNAIVYGPGCGTSPRVRLE
jgi:hypothetical protein